jgi:hypothetical protein
MTPPRNGSSWTWARTWTYLIQAKVDSHLHLVDVAGDVADRVGRIVTVRVTNYVKHFDVEIPGLLDLLRVGYEVGVLLSMASNIGRQHYSHE